MLEGPTVCDTLTGKDVYVFQLERGQISSVRFAGIVPSWRPTASCEASVDLLLLGIPSYADIVVPLYPLDTRNLLNGLASLSRNH